MKNPSQTNSFSIGEVLSKSWSVFSGNFINILLVVLLTYLPVNLISYAVGGHFSDSMIVSARYFPLTLLSHLWSNVGLMIIILISSRHIHNDVTVNLTEDFKNAFSRWWSCLGTQIISGLIVIGLLFCLIVPGVIWAIYYSFIIQIVVLKKVGGKTALNYSKSLVKGNSKTFAILFIIRLISIAPEYIATHFTQQASGLAILATGTVIDLFTAFFTIIFTVMFLRLDALQPSVNLTPDEAVSIPSVN
jgi:hypothetical protein